MLSGTPTVTEVHVSSTEWSPAFVDYLSDHGMGSLGYRIPTGSSAQLKSLPWLNIDKLTISFSDDVQVQKGSLSLTAIGVPTLPVESFTYFSDESTDKHVATWTFANAFVKNVYQIDLNGGGLSAVASLDGVALDGEWTNGSDTMPSGNGQAGGDFQFLFRVMPGDVTQNSSVQNSDYLECAAREGLTTESANYSVLADVDGDGAHEAEDSQSVLSYVGSTYQSGSPVGKANDAPTTTGGGSVQITNPAIDVALSLWSAFSDVETPDNQLSYQIVSNANPSLFDSVTINASTGNLVLNSVSGASGRSEITVRATDASGQSATATFVADVNYSNQAPVLDYVVICEGLDIWRFVGQVTDDASVEGLVVEFTGPANVRVSVSADGTFEFAVMIHEEDWGQEIGYVEDRQGIESAEVEWPIGIS